MWKLLLVSASILSAQEAFTDCSNGADATARTATARGPAGVTAALQVSSHDDHSKDTHDCMAEYQLLVQPATGDSAAVADLDSSDADWGRRLSIRLDGFSRDGKRIFGILSEAGRFPSVHLFDYDTATRHANLFDLKSGLAQLRGARCGATFAVAGTTETGSVVLEPNTQSSCRTNYRWLVDAKGGLQRLPPGKPVVGLYK